MQKKLKIGRNADAGLKHSEAGGDKESIGTSGAIEITGHRSAQEIFESYSDRFNLNFERQADVLVNWCGEGMIEPLMQFIESTGQTKNFAQFMKDNFKEDDSQRT